MIDRCPTCGTMRDAAGACHRCRGAIALPELLEPLQPRGPVGEFVAGVRISLRGAALTLRRRRLLLLVIVPAILNLAIFVGLVVLFATHQDAILPELADPWPTGLDWARGVVRWLLSALAFLFGLLFAALGTFVLSTVVNAPFLEFLSEAVESIVLGRTDEARVDARYVWNTWLIPLLQAVGLALVQGVVAVVLFALSFTGVLTPLVVLGGLWMAAITLCDYAIARKRYPVQSRFHLVHRMLPFHLGLAVPVFLVPFLLPFGVAGGTLGQLRQRTLGRGHAGDEGPSG